MELLKTREGTKHFNDAVKAFAAFAGTDFGPDHKSPEDYSPHDLWTYPSPSSPRDLLTTTPLEDMVDVVGNSVGPVGDVM